jgi:hypothetical protein
LGSERGETAGAKAHRGATGEGGYGDHGGSLLGERGDEARSSSTD